MVEGPKTAEVVAGGAIPPLPVLKLPTAFGTLEVIVTKSHQPKMVRVTLNGPVRQCFDVRADQAADFFIAATSVARDAW